VAESFVQVPIDGAGKKLRSEELVVGANTVHQEVVILADSAGDKAEIDVAGNLQIDINASSVTVPISAVALPLPAGASTSALQLPNSHDVTIDNAGAGAAVNIQDGGNILTVDAVDLDIRDLTHISDSVRIGDGTLTATVRDTGASDSLNVAIVDAAGAHITSFGGGVQYTEGDVDLTITGTAAMMEVAGSTLQPVQGTVADGLLVNLGLNNDVTVTGSVTVSGAVTADTELPAATAMADNDANPTTSRIGANLLLWDGATWDRAPGTSADGALVNLGTNNDVTVTGAVSIIGTVAVDTELPAALALADNDANPTTSRVGANLLLWDGATWDRAPGNAADGALVNLGTNNDVTVTGSVTVSGTVTADTELPAATALADADANPTTSRIGANALLFNGTTWDRMRGDIANGLDVDVTRSALPTGAATLAEQQTQTTSLSVIDDWDNAASDGASISGDVAHGTADAGEPVKIGGVAVSGSATPTSVAAAARTRFIANQHGIPYVIGGHPNLIVREYDFGVAAQADVNLAAALVAADERIYVTRFEALNDVSTTAAFVSVRAGFGTVSVPTASATGVSGMIGSHPGLAPGSGIIEGSGAGAIAVGGAGEEPRVTTSAATGGNLHVIFAYYLIDETP